MNSSAARWLADRAATIGIRGKTDFSDKHGLDPLAGEENVADAAEADAIAEEMPERPPRIRQRRFLSADPIEPGAVNTGDPAMRIGDGGKQSRPGLAAGIAVAPIPEPGMEAQRHTVERRGDAARAQIGFGMGSLDRNPGAEQPARGFRRALRRGRLAGRKLGRRQAEKAADLVAKVAKIFKAAIGGDEIEEIAMLPCGGIGPFAGGAGTVIRPGETDIEAAAGRIADIADQPIAAMAAAIWEIISAHGLGTARESLRQYRRLDRT